MLLCRHCHEAPRSRPRGLCWNCYYTPAIRGLYPPTSKYTRRGSGLSQRPRPLPPFPTAALPGTPEKVAVLEQRLAQGLELWHPDDAAIDCRELPRFRHHRVG